MPYGYAPTGGGIDPMMLQRLLTGGGNTGLSVQGLTASRPTQPMMTASHMGTSGGGYQNPLPPWQQTLPSGAQDFASHAGIDERLLREFFRSSLLGGGKGGPLSNTLFTLGQGQIPPAIQQQFDTNLARSQAATTEGFGRVGARFGTDLADTLARNANEANVNLQASAMDRALQAIGQATGVGTTVSGMQFARGEGALDRALKAYIAELQMDPLNQLLQMILGGGIPGA
jgi:hypothetical protein